MKKWLLFLFFILVLPTANAFLDLRSLYDSYPEWFDFLVFFAIFGLITRISFGRIFGDQPIQKVLSLVVAFALAFSGVYTGYLSLGGLGNLFAFFGPIFWLAVFVFLFIGLYLLLNKVFKKIWLALLLTILVSLSLAYIIFPEGVLRNIPLDFVIIGNVVSFLTILFVIFVIFGLLSFGLKLLRTWTSRIPGSRGLRGPRGEIGESGIVGKKGRPGRRGKGGERGEWGERGPTGPIGFLGRIGRRGRRGPSGVTGPTGLVGGLGRVRGGRRLRAVLIQPRPRFGRQVKVKVGENVRFVGMVKGGSGRYVAFVWRLDGRDYSSRPSSLDYPYNSIIHVFTSEGRFRLVFGVMDSNREKAYSRIYIVEVRRDQEKKEIQQQEREQLKRQRMVRHLEYLAQRKNMELQKWQMMAAKDVEGAEQKVRTLQSELEEISRKIQKYRY